MADTAPPPPADEEYAPEQWTYGGPRLGSDGKKWALWYTADPERTPRSYQPDKGAGYVVGALYEVLVARVPAPDGDGDRTWRRGAGKFLRSHPDPEWRAQVQATAYANERKIAEDQLEKRAKRAPGALDDAVAPLVRLAATMTYAQRDALIAMVTRKVYRANTADAKAPPSQGERAVIHALRWDH